MKVLVTGSEGFVGKHLVKKLEEIGHSVEKIDLKLGTDILTSELPIVDKVIHLAAQTDAFCEAAAMDAEVNIMGTIRLLDKYGYNLVFASSTVINYKHCPYAISKTAADLYCKLYGANIVRFCNLYGEGGHSAIDKFREGDEINIRGDGTQLRTYAPVEDAIKALIDMMEIDRFGMETILPGTDMSVLEVAAMFPDKKVNFVDPLKYDIADGRQL